jgi:hypothetical protein
VANTLRTTISFDILNLRARRWISREHLFLATVQAFNSQTGQRPRKDFVYVEVPSLANRSLRSSQQMGLGVIRRYRRLRATLDGLAVANNCRIG